MKKILLFTTLIFSQFYNAQSIDVFNYSGALNTNGWTTHSGILGQMQTLPTSLTYPGLPSSTGNKTTLVSGNSEDLNKPVSGYTDSIYFSFILNPINTTGLGTTGDYFTGIGGAAGTTLTSLWARVQIKSGTAPNTINLGITNSSGAASFATTDYPTGIPLFVVVMLDKSVSPHVAKLFINPIPGAPTPAASVSNTANIGTLPAIASLFLRQGSATGNLEIDEILAGNTFASVTPSGTVACSISGSGFTGLSCNDAGTTSIPADDYLTFNLNPTGTLLGTTYSVTVSSGTVTPSSGSYGSASSFQLQAGSAGAGNVTITVTDNSTIGCSITEIISDPGSCSSSLPLITLTPSSLNGFDHLVGTPSAEQTFTTTGISLMGDITIIAPVNFEISLSTGTGFTNTLLLTQTTGNVATTTIYVRGNSPVAGSFAGSILATSSGALNDTVQVSGSATDYVYYTIDQISTTDTSGVADSLNVLVELTGVVHCIDFDGNAGYSITLIDGSASGINLFSFTDKSNYTNPIEGDSLRVFGKIAQYNGLLEVDADSIVLLAQGVALVAPIVVANLDETTESQYIKMLNMTLVTPMATFGPGSTNVNITDGTNIFVMRIDSDTDIPSAAAPQGTFNVIGVGGQFDSSLPHDSGYQIFPCSLASIEDTCVPPSNAIIATATDASAIATGVNITYQWVDCANNLPINGATNQNFSPAVSGNYLVMVSNGNCSSSSQCVFLNGVFGIEENILGLVKAYPNPTTDVMTIENNSAQAIVFKVVDVKGRVLSTNTIVSDKTTFSTSNWESGIYFLHFTSNKGETILKIVK